MKPKFFILFTAIMVAPILWATDSIPNNQIWYTSSDGLIVTPNTESSDKFNVKIVSNIYENGKGVITFDGDLIWLGLGAFRQSHLTSIILPNSLKSIHNICFNECTELLSVTLPAGIDTIGHACFSYCSSLASISIPASVKVLDNLCFYNCSMLTDVYVYWKHSYQIPQERSTYPDSTVNEPYVWNNAFWSIACQDEFDCGQKYATLHVPFRTLDLYEYDTYWKKFGVITEDSVLYHAAIDSINAVKQRISNPRILTMADNAIAAITNAQSENEVSSILEQAMTDIEMAEAILNDMPTEGTYGPAVVITKGEKSLTLINPDNVTYKLIPSDNETQITE